MSERESADDFHELLMAWGAWRQGWNRSHLGYGRTIYERMIAGLRGVTCPKCIGRGKLRGLVMGKLEPEWTTCPVCCGRGRVKVATRGKINPALIPSTGGDRPEPDEPEIYSRIDRAMVALTVRQRIVIITRYVDYPRRHDATRRWQNVNAWLTRIGEKPVGKRYLVEELLPAAKRDLWRAMSGDG